MPVFDARSHAQVFELRELVKEPDGDRRKEVVVQEPAADDHN